MARLIDAVEVVRCKYCGQAENSVLLPEGVVYCNVWDTCTKCDGFCHHGVKNDGKDIDVPTNPEPLRRPEDCVNFATRPSDGKAVCMGTRELERCEGNGCERWQAK